MRRRAWTQPELGPCKQGLQEPGPHPLQARLPSGLLGLRGGSRRATPARVGALRPQRRQVALSPPLPLWLPQLGHRPSLLCIEVRHTGWGLCLHPGQQAC